MKLYFDLSALHPWEKKDHTAAWEALVSGFPQQGSDDLVTFDPADADVTICPSSPGFYDAPLRLILKPLTAREVEMIAWDWGDVPLGRMSGFYCSLAQPLFDPNRHRTMPYPITFNELVEFFPYEDATYNFGLVGGITAGVRQRIFDRFASETRANALVRVQPADWTTIFDRYSLSIKRDYAESLRRTRFVLCPRGAGVGSVRLFETMKAGRVPIIISDGYVLPSGVDWSRCSITIREKDIEDIPHIVESRLADWAEMAAEARRVWLRQFSPTGLFPYLVDQLKAILGTMPQVDRKYQVAYSASVSSALVRRYARPALGRIKALVTQGGVRGSH